MTTVTDINVLEIYNVKSSEVIMSKSNTELLKTKNSTTNGYNYGRMWRINSRMLKVNAKK